MRLLSLRLVLRNVKFQDANSQDFLLQEGPRSGKHLL
jgi:hypothetical protein